MIRLILALPTSCPRCAENQAAKLLDQDGLEPLATIDLQCVCPASEVVSLLEEPEPKRAKPNSENVKPIRQKARTDTKEPKLTMSKTDTERT